MFSLAPEYNHKLKQIKTPGGRNLTAVTASARTIYVNVSTGALILKDWATATASKLTQSGELTNADGTPWDGTSKPWQNGKPVTTALTDQVKLAGFPTASVGDTTSTNETVAEWEERSRKAKKTNPNLGGLHMKLGIVAQLAGFPTTTTTRDSKSEGKDGPNRTGAPSLPALVRGVILPLFFVPTGRRVVLAPEFSLWLMGFPEAWVTAAPGAKDWREAQAELELECSREAGTPSSPSLPPSSCELLWRRRREKLAR